MSKVAKAFSGHFLILPQMVLIYPGTIDNLIWDTSTIGIRTLASWIHIGTPGIGRNFTLRSWRG